MSYTALHEGLCFTMDELNTIRYALEEVMQSGVKCEMIRKKTL